MLPDCGERAIMVRRAKQSPLKLPVSAKIINWKPYCIHTGTEEINATTKDLKKAGAVVHIIPPCSPDWPLQNPGGPWWVGHRLL